jgi:hypothetical protein
VRKRLTGDTAGRLRDHERVARFCDELELGFGWVHPEPSWMERTSHAIRADGRVWVVDPTDVADAIERIPSLGEPAGVVQLLDRHRRDCAAVAARLGVPLLRVPFDGVPGSPFEVLGLIDRRFWKEVALWWPAERMLVCADVLGTAPHYLARGEWLATSPVLRLTPPTRLLELDARHVLCGHGSGIHGAEAPRLVREALTTSRRRAPRWLASYLRMVIAR